MSASTVSFAMPSRRGMPPCAGHHGSDAVRIAVVDLARPQRLSGLLHLISRRENRNDRAPVHADGRPAERCQHANLGWMQHRALLHDHLAPADVFGGTPDVRACGRGLQNPDDIP